MAIARMNGQAKKVPQEDLVAVTKAIYDRVKTLLDSRLGEMESRLDSKLTDRLTQQENKSLTAHESYKTGLVSVTKSFEGGMDKRLEEKSVSIQRACENKLLDHFSKKLDQEVTTLQKSYETSFGTMVKASEERMTKQLEDATRRAEARLDEKSATYREDVMKQAVSEMKALVVGEVKSALESLQKSHEFGLEQIKVLLQTMPTPQVTVNVPQDAIRIDQAPSQVVIPEKAIQIEVNQKLMMPTRRTTTTKDISYDHQTGRPAQITESTEERSEE